MTFEHVVLFQPSLRAEWHLMEFEHGGAERPEGVLGRLLPAQQESPKR